jgi:hypothetical protein
MASGKIPRKYANFCAKKQHRPWRGTNKTNVSRIVDKSVAERQQTGIYLASYPQIGANKRLFPGNRAKLRQIRSFNATDV